MTWKKVFILVPLFCVLGTVLLNQWTLHRQHERVAEMQKQILDLQAKLEVIRSQEQLIKNAGKAPVPVAKPSPGKPATSSTGD